MGQECGQSALLGILAGTMGNDSMLAEYLMINTKRYAYTGNKFLATLKDAFTHSQLDLKQAGWRENGEGETVLLKVKMCACIIKVSYVLRVLLTRA